MNYVITAQYMAAAAFWTVAMIHGLIWLRARGEIVHLLFAVTAAAAGAGAVSEAAMYQSGDVETMASSLRWYVAASGAIAIAALSFIVSYANVGRFGRELSAVIMTVMALAMILNHFSQASFLYTELTGLRVIALPWGDRLWLAVGEDNPFRVATELALLAILAAVADGSYQLYQRGERKRAVIFGVSVVTFFVLFATHAFLVDTGRLDSPYLTTFGFLALVALTSYDIAGEVMRKSILSSELRQLESELRTAIADERNRIAGELHDSVTQTLFSTAAIADALPEVWRRDPEEAKRGLEDLRQLTKGALAEMRTLLLELHPATLLEKNLGDLLKQLAEATAARTRIPVNVQVDGDRNFPDHVHVTLYRIAQESLNNVLKHSGATKVKLHLDCHGPQALLQVNDDGCGFDIDDHTPGMGLRLMQQRADSIGALWSIDSEFNVGTSITVKWDPGSEVNA